MQNPEMTLLGTDMKPRFSKNPKRSTAIHTYRHTSSSNRSPALGHLCPRGSSAAHASEPCPTPIARIRRVG
eukprot:1151448-Pelagomonas_calceolata.AAC.3